MNAVAPQNVSEPCRVENQRGRSPFVLVCDHASNFLPASFGRLGLEDDDLTRHIAWDPGALPVARQIAEALDAVLVHSCVSRLVIDCNRPLDAPDLVPVISESTVIPGNVGLSAIDRQKRIELSWRPFHATIEEVIGERLERGMKTRVVSVHSFTPVYHGRSRPWQVGIIHDEDTRLAAPVIAALQAEEGLSVGINEPYSPADRVYYTLERHARSRDLPCVMVEIRNDGIADQAGQRRWAALLTRILAGIGSCDAEAELAHPGAKRRA